MISIEIESYKCHITYTDCLLQVDNVRNVTDAMTQALEELERVKEEEEKIFLQQQVNDLKERYDQMVVVLKVCYVHYNIPCIHIPYFPYYWLTFNLAILKYSQFGVLLIWRFCHPQILRVN